jgi:hypothetical protein
MRLEALALLVVLLEALETARTQMTVLAMVRVVEIELRVCAQVETRVFRQCQRRELICVEQRSKLMMTFTVIRPYHGID